MRVTRAITEAAILLGFLLSLPSSAQAVLEERAGGAAYYDTDMNVTWTADANLAATQNFGVNIDFGGGLMAGTTVANYLAAANAAEYLGVNTWRRPSTLVPDATCTFDAAGTMPPFADSIGFNCSGSEMGHLFYGELGGEAGVGGATGDPSVLAFFDNLQLSAYWSDPGGGQFRFFVFDNNTQSGAQSLQGSGNGGSLFLVADGDVLAPPVPSMSPGVVVALLVSIVSAASLELRRRRS